MSKIIECVPNISEGRDSAVVDAVAGAAANVPGVTLLDRSSDPSHNRSVITFIGAPDAVADAALALAAKAVELIDLTVHRGEHPRMGAVDVIPFIPLREVGMDECAALSRAVAERVWSRLELPVYLYELSASAPSRRNLADVRRGQFEGLAEKMRLPGWAPDLGGPAPHPTAGAVAVGARRPLVAFNVNLSTPDIKIARAIARTIRESGGGWDCVKALGVSLEHRGLAQVSINMTDTGRTPLYRVLETVRFEARRWGADVVGTELVGLAPMSALIDSAAYYLQLEGFDGAGRVLESHLP